MYAVKEGHVEVVRECFDQVDHAIKTKVNLLYCSLHEHGKYH